MRRLTTNRAAYDVRREFTSHAARRTSHDEAMIRVTTGSRLHFGLIGLGADAPRRFGGVGLMVERPGLSLRAEDAAEWSASGPLAERALGFARRFAANVGSDRPQRLTVEQAPPEHVGLGTGTQ